MKESTDNQHPPKKSKKWTKRFPFWLLEAFKVISSILNIFKFIERFFDEQPLGVVLNSLVMESNYAQ